MSTVGELCLGAKKYLALAESLTGGLVSAEIVSEAGASKYFLGSIVSYSDQTKIGLLGVDKSSIAQETAVSAEVSVQMALGARSALARANGLDITEVVALSTTGVAGPEPVGSQPVGLVFFGVSSALGERWMQAQFAGDRAEIRQAATRFALELVREELTALFG